MKILLDRHTAKLHVKTIQHTPHPRRHVYIIMYRLQAAALRAPASVAHWRMRTHNLANLHDDVIAPPTRHTLQAAADSHSRPTSVPTCAVERRRLNQSNELRLVTLCRFFIRSRLPRTQVASRPSVGHVQTASVCRLFVSLSLSLSLDGWLAS